MAAGDDLAANLWPGEPVLRSIVKMTTRRAAVLLLSAGIAFMAFACGGGSKNNDFTEVSVKDDDVTPVIASSELVIGPNRFVLGFLDKDGQPIVDAKVHLKFFDLTSGSTVEKFETDTFSSVPARDAGLTEEVIHVHADGTKHAHLNAGEDLGVYTALVTFDKAGVWGVDAAIDSQKPKVKQSIKVRFDVLPKGETPGIGSAAPRSKNLTVVDVKDVSEIDSSAKPSPEFHTITIADAIAAGKPTLVLFAVPGYCESRLCGPELEIMRKLAPSYAGRANFIHVEFYKNPGSPERVVSDAVQEWRLRTEPWFFVVDGKGVITAKFEGPTSLSELDQAMSQVAAK
jgi:hypothetical protein